MLPSYYQHVCRYENSLVTRFFGVHCVKPIGGQKVMCCGDKFELFWFTWVICFLIFVYCDWKADPVHCNGQFILLRVSDP